MTIGVRTTQIGSLPHHNIDTALEYSFRHDIPFLPQIPIRNPWEYMIPQALEGIAGLRVETDGSTHLDLDVWKGRSHVLSRRLEDAFTHARQPDAFEEFEPSAATSSSWQPFLWELEERLQSQGQTHRQFLAQAKIQLAGPLTLQWALRLSSGERVDQIPELAHQIYQLVTARALGMCRRLKASGIQPTLFLDEPAMIGYTPSQPTHRVALQELRILVSLLAKEGVQVGLHCCSDTHWDEIFSLGVHILSLDTQLSLHSLAPSALKQFHNQGGRLCLGVIPTNQVSPNHAPLLAPFNVTQSTQTLIDQLDRAYLANAWLSPACGLALLSPTEADTIYTHLQQLKEALCQKLAS